MNGIKWPALLSVVKLNTRMCVFDVVLNVQFFSSSASAFAVAGSRGLLIGQLRMSTFVASILAAYERRYTQTQYAWTVEEVVRFMIPDRVESGGRGRC